MKKYWKQFEALVTGSKADLFSSARLRLTAYYLLIMTGVLVIAFALLATGCTWYCIYYNVMGQ